MNTPAQHWSLERDADGIAGLMLDRKDAPANSLSEQVMRELAAQLAALAQNLPRALVILSGKSNGFVAGADISEFRSDFSAAQALELIRGGQQVLDQLAALPCPTVAAIHGFCLGGGLELTLACGYRVASNDRSTSLGLPEVNLGIHPGFGGTVRAPALVGVRAAMPLMLTGVPVRADKALKLGLVDRVVPVTELRAAARALAMAPPQRRRAPWLDRLLGLPGVRGWFASQLEAQVARKVRRAHYPAPYAVAALWRATGGRGRRAYEAEARSIANLFGTSTSKNLVRVFFLQTRMKAMGAGMANAFQRVHVVGAGVMGGDIAALCAWRGMEVTLQDREERLVVPALQRAREAFVKQSRGDAARLQAATARLRMDLTGEGAATADVVIEAIYENAEAKRALYASLLPRMPPAALLCTNTSSLVLEDLARELPDPARLVGLHFFNPVSRMPLVEVIRGSDTAPATVELALAFTRALDKLPLPCKSAPGFVVNRVLTPYMLEAMLAADEGVPLAEIDRVALEHGFPMGPIELADTVGLDIGVSVGKVLAAAFGERARPQHVQDLVAAGKLGKKSGEGFYPWKDGKAVKPAVPAGYHVPTDLQDRLVMAFVNEAVACLHDGVVAEADLLDAGVIFGTGYAPFRGGPLHYARERGIDNCLTALKSLEERHGSRFSPAAGWNTLRD
jgi:3-hydroxyacyl-CoA dehydrogenase/enoyl-CoA hydratase/3-hydroxybutyryl-CoA epimerase